MFTSVHWTRQNSEWCRRSWIWGLISISHYPLHNFGQEASPTSASIFLSVKWGQWHILILQLWQDFSRNLYNEMGCEACKALALLAGGHTLCQGTWPGVSPPVSSPAPRGCRTCPVQLPRSRDPTDCLGWVTSRAVTSGKTRRRSEFGKYLAITHLCSHRQLNCFLSATLLNGKRLLSRILGCVTTAWRTGRSASWGFYSPIRRRREWADPMAMEK